MPFLDGTPLPDDATTFNDLVQAIREAGLSNGAVCLHSSLKSFGYVVGGSKAVVQAFLDSGCTLVVPSFTYECEVAPPPGRVIPQNGLETFRPFGEPAVYDRDDNLITLEEMGAIPAQVLALEGRARGNHPLNSFAAVGPLAQEIIERQAPLNVYGPLKELYARSPAFMALIGVDLTKATSIHLGEEMAGRRLFRRWAKDSNDVVLEVEVGSCSEGFNNFAPFLASIEKTLQVGPSTWRLYPFRAFIDTIAAAIVQNPHVTHCPNQNCARCNDAVKGGPIL
jgi:aminoglycoside N3'-acetyltransferase